MNPQIFLFHTLDTKFVTWIYWLNRSSLLERNFIIIFNEKREILQKNRKILLNHNIY